MNNEINDNPKRPPLKQTGGFGGIKQRL